MTVHGACAHSPGGGLPPLVPGRDRQGRAGRQRPGPRDHGDPPVGYAIWERMLAEMDARIKAAGAENAYFPLFIPETYLRREAAARRGLRAGAGGGHPRRRQAARRAGRDPADQRDGHRRVHGQVDAVLPGPAAAAQPVGQRACAGRCGRGCSCVPPSSSGRRGTPRTRTEADARAYARRILHEVYEDFMVNVLAMPVVVGPQDGAGAVRRRDQHVHARGMMRDGKALQMGTSPRAGAELRPGVRHRLLSAPRAARSTAGPRRGAARPGWSAA